MANRTCLSYWFPKLLTAGLPVPRTEIVRTDLRLSMLIYGEECPPDLRVHADSLASFVAELRTAADKIGYPAFLRTGQGSGKHDWSRCCFLRDRDKIDHHVMALVEWSSMVDFIGLQTDVWAVREMLPVKPIGVCDRYGGMPVVKEFRFFIRDGNVICRHPYWPIDALNEGGLSAIVPEGWYEEFCRIPEDLEPLAVRVSKAFAKDGAWSVDLLETDRGWYVTDMAEAERSFHWEGCAAWRT